MLAKREVIMLLKLYGKTLVRKCAGLFQFNEIEALRLVEQEKMIDDLLEADPSKSPLVHDIIEINEEDAQFEHDGYSSDENDNNAKALQVEVDDEDECRSQASTTYSTDDDTIYNLLTFEANRNPYHNYNYEEEDEDDDEKTRDIAPVARPAIPLQRKMTDPTILDEIVDGSDDEGDDKIVFVPKSAQFKRKLDDCVQAPIKRKKIPLNITHGHRASVNDDVIVILD